MLSPAASSYLSFRLPEEFLETYKDRKVPWGYADSAGNSLGEITFLRTYSRRKPCEHGYTGDEDECLKPKEHWWETCRRVIEGTFSIQKDWCKTNRLPWNDHKAQRTAQDAYERLFTFKWTPPGRGLWMMGTPLVNLHRNSAALQNCAFVSTGDMTKYDPAEPFAFLMEASMLGVGVGFDTKGAEKGFVIHQPIQDKEWTYVITDDREGWAQSLKHQLESYLMPSKGLVKFDYSELRPKGTPIKTFGGTAAGPEPLMQLHEKLDKIFAGREGDTLTSMDIVDVANLVGVCVVSGNVRRSAELALGSIDDEDFINAKNIEAAPYRADWAFMSNNSVSVEVGDDLSSIVDGIALNGEPGVIWLDTSRKYGRLIDGPNNKDWRVAGYNPCAEQSLESFEMCTLVETYLNRHESLEDFKKTLKVAYLYAKTVTLMPTHWQRTNAIMQRNRRIGTSVSGMANFADRRGMTELRTWLNEGYGLIQGYDETYSEWLCVRPSIKTTTVKPSGTVSILAGESPGVHWTPGGDYFNRGIVFDGDDAMVPLFQAAGYKVYESAYTKGSVFVQFPIHTGFKRSERDVTVFEKANLAVLAQRYWSDNSVSVTLSFDKDEEAKHIETVLHMHEGQLKTVSFLPMGNDTYQQMPYTQISPEDYEQTKYELMPMDLEPIYNGLGADAIGEKFCTTDVCLIKVGE